MKIWDVIIIGAGPSGSISAKEISKHNLSCLILEKEESAGKSPCAGASICFLSRKLNLPDEIIEKKIKKIIFNFEKKKLINLFNTPKYFTTYREKFDNYLLKEAINKGADVLYNNKVIKVKRVSGLYEIISFDRIEKKEKVFLSRVVIFACGASNFAYENLGIGINLNKQIYSIAIAYELEFKENNLEAIEIFYKKAIGPGYFWIIPKKETINVGVGTLIKSGFEKNLKEKLEKFLYEKELDKMKKSDFIAGKVPLFLAEKLYRNNAFVIGDSAGFVNTLTGGGIVHAVKSGEIVGKVVSNLLLSKRGTSQLYERRFKRTPYFFILKCTNIIGSFCKNLKEVNEKLAYLIYFWVLQFYAFLNRLIMKFLR